MTQVKKRKLTFSSWISFQYEQTGVNWIWIFFTWKESIGRSSISTSQPWCGNIHRGEVDNREGCHEPHLVLATTSFRVVKRNIGHPFLLINLHKRAFFFFKTVPIWRLACALCFERSWLNYHDIHCQHVTQSKHKKWGQYASSGVVLADV